MALVEAVEDRLVDAVDEATDANDCFRRALSRDLDVPPFDKAGVLAAGGSSGKKNISIKNF